MTNPLQLPFDFPPNATPTTQQIKENFNALLNFVQNLNDAVISLSNLVLTSSLQLPDGSVSSPALKYTNSLTTGLYRPASSTMAVTTGGVKAWQADSGSNITQPLQPAFLVQRIATFGNSHTGDIDPFVFDTESYDVGNNFASNVFTAPVAGKYFFALSTNVGPRIGTPATFFNVKLVTTNQSLSTFKEAPSVDENVPFSTIVDMALGDTAKVTVVVGAGVTWSSEVDANSFFMGSLIN